MTGRRQEPTKNSLTARRWSTPLLLAYSLALVTATHWPGNVLPVQFSWQDKLVHTVCYFGLAVLAYWTADSQGWVGRSLRSTLIIALVVSAFGAIDEWTQRFAPGRYPDVWDWVADTLGGVAGACTYAWAYRFLAPQKFGVGGR